MKLTLITTALVLSLGGVIVACAKEGTGPDTRAGTTTITSQQEQAPGDNATASKAMNPTGVQQQGVASDHSNSSGAESNSASRTEGRGEATAPPGPPKTGPEGHGFLPKFTPPHPANTGDPPPPPLRQR